MRFPLEAGTSELNSLPCIHTYVHRGAEQNKTTVREHGHAPHTCVSLSLGSSKDRAADASSKAFPTRMPCRCDASKRLRADRSSARVLTSWKAREEGEGGKQKERGGGETERERGRAGVCGEKGNIEGGRALARPAIWERLGT